MKTIPFQVTAVLAGIALAALSASSARGQQTNSPGLSETQPATDLTPDRNNLTSLQAQAQQTIQTIKAKNPKLSAFFSSATGYAVFPSVTEGAAIIGGAHGDGIAYQNGRPIGRATLSKGTVGAQLGGQTFAEVVFFQNEKALNEFKQGNFAFTAGANAVAGDAGAGAVTEYKNGVAVITTSRSGLMAKAAVGGQKFSFEPLAAGGTSDQTGVSSGSESNSIPATGSVSNQPASNGGIRE